MATNKNPDGRLPARRPGGQPENIPQPGVQRYRLQSQTRQSGTAHAHRQRTKFISQTQPQSRTSVSGTKQNRLSVRKPAGGNKSLRNQNHAQSTAYTVKGTINWGDEVANVLGIIGRVLLRVLIFICSLLLTILLIGMLTGTIVAGAFAIYVNNYIDADLEGFDLIVSDQDLTTKIYYMDYTDRENRIGEPVELEEQRIYGSQNRTTVSFTEMPKYLYEAFISIEDHRFWDHEGVDWLRTVNATFTYFLGGSDTRKFGASTITQQLIKNITGDDDVTIQRKVQEILRALELENTKDKTEIITMYLNTIFLSQRCYGVQAAAYTYFGKEVKDLTLIECAALAAIPQSPTAYDPVQNPDNNTKRRNVVLDRMLDLGKISKAEYDDAYDKELVLNLTYEKRSTATNSWYKDQVINDAVDLLSVKYNCSAEVAKNMVYAAGLSIYTVMDPEVQSTLDKIFADDSNFLAVSGIIQPECASTVIDPATGDILGIAGGRGEKTESLVYNFATQAKRPPGSSIKPISVYGPALEYGVVNYATVFDDVPLNFGESATDFATGETTYSRPDGWPNNYPSGYRGLTTVNNAVTRSVNTISLRVLEKLTIQRSFDFMKNKLGLSVVEYRELTGGRSVTDMDYAPLGLGQLSYGLSVVEMTGAFAMYDNKGVYNKPRTIIEIRDNAGNVIVNNNLPGKVVVSENTASIMTKMLQNVVTSGTATRITLRNTVNCAGKTGTTSEDNDRWFVGYTPYYVCGVWFGYEMPRNLNAFTISPAVTIWDTIMTSLHEKYINQATLGIAPLKTFQLANGVITRSYCKDSGLLPTEACKADPRGNRIETGYFTSSTVPTQSCTTHVLVDYDHKSGGIACEECPATKKVGLLNITNRSFPFPIIVTDAEYVWREIPDGIDPCLDPTQPFYASILPSGTYAGVSAGEMQYNRFCGAHYIPIAERVIVADPETPELPEGMPPETVDNIPDKETEQ